MKRMCNLAAVQVLVVLLGSCVFAGSLFAQNPTQVTGTVVDSAASIPYYPALVQACLTPVTTDPIVNGQHINSNPGTNYCVYAQTTASGSFLMSVPANSSITNAPGTQYLFTATTPGAGPPLGTGQKSCATTVTISGTSQDISSSFSCPALSNVSGGGGGSGSLPGAQSFNYIDPTNSAYGVKLDVQFCLNSNFSFGTTTSGNPVTITGSSCSPGPAATDVGKWIQATSWNQSSNAYAISTNLLKACQITSVVPGTSWTCAVGNGSSASTGTGVLMWGTDDTAAWQAVYNAMALGSRCLVAQAVGYSFVNQPLFNTTPTCQLPAWSTPSSHYVGFRGGESSNLVFIPMENSNWTSSCPGGGSSLFFGFQGVTLENIAILGFGNNPGGSFGATCNVIATQIDGTYQNIVVAGFLGTTTNSFGFNFGTVTNAGTHMITNISVSCAGLNNAQVTGNARNARSNFFESCNSNPPLTVNSGANYFALTDDFQNDSTSAAYVVNFGTFECTYCQISSNTTTQSAVVSARQGSFTALTNWIATTNNGNASSDIVATAGGTGATVILRGNQTMTGGSTGRIIFSGSTGDHFILAPDNTFASEIFATTGNIMSVTSSAGTSAAVIDAASRNESGSFTLTGNATASSTTVTLNFVGSFSLTGNAPLCSLILKNGTGTWAATASVIEGTTSATSYAWTLNNQGTNLANGSTYRGVWTCTPR